MRHTATTDWSWRRAVACVKPDLPGLREFGFDVDTYDGAMRLQHHLQRLAAGPPTAAAATAVVVGAGLTGIETACELPDRLRGPGH